MARKVTLLSGDTPAPIGNVLLPSNFPSDPSLLVLDNRIFAAGNIAYGAGSPGNYESYIEVTALRLQTKDVVAPDTEPTEVVVT